MSYLNAEQLIIQQLKDSVALVPDRSVLSAADLDGVLEAAQLSPALHVVLYDDVPVSRSHGVSANHQLIDQFWLVVLMIKNVKNKSGEAARTDAGEMITQIIAGLHHYKMPQPYLKLVRVKAPYRATYRNGFFYFPLMFKTRFSTEGNKNG